MIRLTKSAEPSQITQHRKDRGDWDSWGGAPKQVIRSLLSGDQNKLCAYCENLLPKDFVTDHFHPRTVLVCAANNLADDNSWSLTWGNLFAVCDSGSPKRGSPKGCSAEKGDLDVCGSAYRPTEIPLDAFSVDNETGQLIPVDGRDGKLATTISALKLDRQSLKGSRLKLVETIAALTDLGLSPHDIKTQYAGPNEPFVTTLRYLLGPDGWP